MEKIFLNSILDRFVHQLILLMNLFEKYTEIEKVIVTKDEMMNELDVAVKKDFNEI